MAWNDLSNVEGLTVPAGDWPNDPLLSRQAILDCLALVPRGKWWDLDSFVQFIHHYQPSYLRPAGDFDSWYLQDQESGEFLHGFDFWHRVEGALIRYIITQPLYFLGAVDLGGMLPKKTLSFRLTTRSKTLFNGHVSQEDEEEPLPTKVFPDGRILASASSSPAHRYQVARFCDWVDLTDNGYGYRITPTALQRALDQGLTISQIIALLEAAYQDKLHPSLLRAITRWGKEGREAFIERTIILSVKTQEVMDFLQSEPSISRYLQQILGPTAAIVKEKDLERIYSAASRHGILLDLP
jgi:hypothetical protein